VDEPGPSPDDPIAKAQAEAAAAKQEAADLRAQIRPMLDDLTTMRARLDARELRSGYEPTLGTDPAPPVAVDRLKQFLKDGIDDSEWMAPSGDTLVKIVTKTGALMEQRIDEKLTDHEKRRAIDEAFWDNLGEKWSKDPKTLKRRYGDEVTSISRQVLIDPNTGKTRSEYQGNFDLAFTRVRETLEKRLAMVTEDAPVSKPRPRASTGDAGGSRLPSGPQADKSKQSMNELASEALGLTR
jgi:hypothetical protein